ncbi:MAG TPA: toprim domain-containing protein [Drouetiella sp.]
MKQQSKYITAAAIADSLDATKSGDGYLSRCPAHDDSTPSLSIKQSNERVLLKCFGGCSQHSVIDALRKMNLWSVQSSDGTQDFRKVARGYVCRRGEARSIDNVSRNEFNQRLLNRLLDECHPPQPGDPVDLYLRNTRGIPMTQYPACILTHFELEYRVYDAVSKRSIVDSVHPGMVQVITASDGTICGAQRLYLTDDGRKADVPRQKKLMPSTYPGISGAIRLCEPTDVLAVAEGLETALSFHAMTHHPVWATVNTWGMKNLQIPRTVSKVYICVDIDKSQAGQQAADVLTERLLNEGFKVYHAKPPVAVTGDWSDVLQEALK